MMQVRRHGPGICMVLLHPVAADTRCCEQVENKIWGGDNTHSGDNHRGRGGDHDHGWVGEGEPRNLHHIYIYTHPDVQIHCISGPGGDPIRNPDVPCQPEWSVAGSGMMSRHHLRNADVAMVFIAKLWKNHQVL